LKVVFFTELQFLANAASDIVNGANGAVGQDGNFLGGEIEAHECRHAELRGCDIGRYGFQFGEIVLMHAQKARFKFIQQGFTLLGSQGVQDT